MHENYCEICGLSFDNIKQMKIHIKNAHESDDKMCKCIKCDLYLESYHLLRNHLENVHERKNKCQCKKCKLILEDSYQLKSHLKACQKNKCEKCGSRIDSLKELKTHTVNIHENNIKHLKIGSLNIGRGLYGKEELLINTINEQNLDFCSVSEVDIKDFDELKHFSIKGYKTIFSPGTKTQRLLCFVKEGIEVKQRVDLMSNLLSNIWLEVYGTTQKITDNLGTLMV